MELSKIVTLLNCYIVCYDKDMRIPFKQLKKYSVETSSGVRLGYVRDIVLESEGQMIAQYEVRPYLFSYKKYLISRDQIVRFENDKMIVDDNLALEKSKIQEEKPVPKAEPVLMREE